MVSNRVLGFSNTWIACMIIALVFMGILLVEDASALIAVETFCDLTSERCVQLEGTLKKIEEKYPQQVIIEQHYYTSEEIDEKLVLPMLALECALAQGDFYEAYQSKLKEYIGKSDQYEREHLKQFASDIGLVPANFSFCLDARIPEWRVAEKLGYAERKGVTGVPTIMIGGKRYERISTFKVLDKVVQFHLGLRSTIEDPEALQQEEQDLEEEGALEGVAEPEEEQPIIEEIPSEEIEIPQAAPTYEELYGEEPQDIFQRIVWNIRKWFLPIRKQ